MTPSPVNEQKSYSASLPPSLLWPRFVFLESVSQDNTTDFGEVSLGFIVLFLGFLPLLRPVFDLSVSTAS